MKCFYWQDKFGINMIKLNPPSCNQTDYDKIFFKVDGKFKQDYQVLTNILLCVKYRLNEYSSKLFNLENLDPAVYIHMFPAAFDKLEGLYDLKNLTVKSLKANVKAQHKGQPQSLNGIRCVYCGIMRNEAEDLDHYLPRSVFPEFSILACNLIYVCKTCNQTYKGNLFKDSSGVRCILNPYVDNVEQQILKCKIDFIDITSFIVEYSILPELEYIDYNVYKIALNHFDTLNLNNRYTHVIYDDCWASFINLFTYIDVTGIQKFNNTLIEYNACIDFNIGACDRSNISNFEKLFWEELKSNQTWLSNLPGQSLKCISNN